MIFLGIAFWLLIGAGLRGAYEHSKAERQRSAAQRLKAAEKAAPGGKLPKAQRRKALRRHATGWWAGEVFHGFPVTRTGLHAGYLAHRTAADHQRHVREEARTTALETRASFTPAWKEHRKRQDAARAEILQVLGDAPEGQRTGKEAAQKAADEVAAKRAERESRTDAPVTGTPAPPGELSHWLDPAAGSPCGGCGGSGRNRDRTDACPACRGWGAAPPDPDGPIGPPGTVCAACGRHATGEDPVLADAKVHRSHAVEQTRAYQDALGRMRQPTPGTSDAERAAAWANECAAREPGPDAASWSPGDGAREREEAAVRDAIAARDDWRAAGQRVAAAEASGDEVAAEAARRDQSDAYGRYDEAQHRRVQAIRAQHQHAEEPDLTATASPTTTEGAPVTDTNYTAAMNQAAALAAAADQDAAAIRQRRQEALTLQEGMQAAKVDSASLSAVMELAERYERLEQEAVASGEQATVVGTTLQRGHGGIHEAVQEAPVAPADTAFYTGD